MFSGEELITVTETTANIPAEDETTTLPSLILDTRRQGRRLEDNQLMLVMGQSYNMKHDQQIGEIIGRRRSVSNILSHRPSKVLISIMSEGR